MIRKITKYFIIILISFFIIPITISNIIFYNKFTLKSKDLKGFEEMTSKVFTLTNNNKNQKMNHMRLRNGIDFLQHTYLDNQFTEHFFFIYQTAMNYFKFDGYLCGGHSLYLKRIFDKHGIKSFTYNHGINNTRYTHVIVVAEYNDNLYIFDPTYNYVYHDNEKYLTFKNVINIVSEKKSLEKYIKVINPQDKIFNMGQKKYKSFTSSYIIERQNRAKHLMDIDKEHLLLNGFGMDAGINMSMDYFYEKYPYLKSLF